MSSKGLVCPTCGTNLHEVSHTILRIKKIVRYRRCFNGHRFKTEEVLVTSKGKHLREKVRSKVLLLLKDHTAAQAAEKAGVSKHTVYRIKRGEKPKRKYK